MSVEITLSEIEDNILPDDASVGQLEAYDGVMLRYAIFKAVAGLGRGTICLFGGRSEPIEKYFETIKKFQLRGFCVVMMDWRGQGLSDRATVSRRKGHVSDFGKYVKDVEMLMKKVAWVDCPAPYYAVAHSMGANILTQVAALPKTNAYFERMLLVSPFYQFEISNFKFTIVKIISRVLSILGMGKFKATFLEGGPKELKPFDPNNLISSDKKRMRREQKIIKGNLNLALGAPTFGWLNAAIKSIKKINQISFAKKVKTPMLILLGTDDFLVSQQSIRDFARQISGCGIVEIHGGRHELLMENDALLEQVWAAIDAFIPGTYKVGLDESNDSAFS